MTSTKTVSKKNIKNIISPQKKKVKRKKKNDDIKGKNRKDSKRKMQISQRGVTRSPSQFESYPLSASSNQTRGEVIRPPSQIKNNCYSMI